MRNDTGHQLYKFDTNRITNSLELTKESLDGASDSLDGDSEIKLRLIVRRNMMTRLSGTASARQLLLQGYGCISSVYISSAIAYCITLFWNCSSPGRVLSLVY